MFEYVKRSQPSTLPANPGRFIQRKCACGGAPGVDGEGADCRRQRLASTAAAPSLPETAQPIEERRTAAQRTSSQIRILPTQVPFGGREDPIHGPLLEEYRRSVGSPPGGVDESGARVGPSDAELKYSGALGSFNIARWLPPTINRRNFAEVVFNARPAAEIREGTIVISSAVPAGETIPFINGVQIESNADLSRAIGWPGVQTRAEGSQAYGWLVQGLAINGQARLDILTPGPWNHEVSKADAADRFGEAACRGGGGNARIHIDARPSDAAMETFIREGESEHNADMQRSFERNLGEYVANINRHVGDTPYTRVSAPTSREAETRLRSMVAQWRDQYFTQFVLDLNAMTDVRHRGGRHSVLRGSSSANRDCSVVDVTMTAGRL